MTIGVKLSHLGSWPAEQARWRLPDCLYHYQADLLSSIITGGWALIITCWYITCMHAPTHVRRSVGRVNVS